MAHLSMQALLTFLLPSVLAVASAGLGGAAHGRGAQVGASETDVNVSARKFSSLLKLHNETFKALLKRAKALWTEASDAVNEFEKVRKIAGDFKGKKTLMYEKGSTWETARSPHCRTVQQMPKLALQTS
ncbi:hypothetical protein ERJ75_000156600 [Trypanosoma vivax]|nr:hypothetical protein ERJ75_000156600 [Trypanosoma vivax]